MIALNLNPNNFLLLSIYSNVKTYKCAYVNACNLTFLRVTNSPANDVCKLSYAVWHFDVMWCILKFAILIVLVFSVLIFDQITAQIVDRDY